MLADFERLHIDCGDATLAVSVAGDGPSLLLLHGYPQTHVAWHRLAPKLTDQYTVVAPDLRGYGDSTGPTDPDTADYSNRVMADDLVVMMESLGFDAFRLAGHDRGARVGYRLALDHPDRVRRLALLDIVPTLETAELMDVSYAKQMYHWLFLAQPYPVPETLIGHDPGFYVDHLIASWAADPDALDPAAVAAYHRAFEDAAVVRASCEDYRAGLSVDLEHDHASRDADDRIDCPVLALWGAASGTVSFDPLAIWERWATDVTGRGLPCGHFVMEEAPGLTFAEFDSFFA